MTRTALEATTTGGFSRPPRCTAPLCRSDSAHGRLSSSAGVVQVDMHTGRRMLGMEQICDPCITNTDPFITKNTASNRIAFMLVIGESRHSAHRLPLLDWCE